MVMPASMRPRENLRKKSRRNLRSKNFRFKTFLQMACRTQLQPNETPWLKMGWLKTAASPDKTANGKISRLPIGKRMPG